MPSKDELQAQIDTLKSTVTGIQRDIYGWSGHYVVGGIPIPGIKDKVDAIIADLKLYFEYKPAGFTIKKEG